MSRGKVIYGEMQQRAHCETDRMFGKLLIAQWVFAIGLALVISPYSYAGETRSLHFHVKAAIGLGALINSLPLALIHLRPGWWGTRQVVAVVQMLWSAMLIMITGGRMETHFHVFGSLAFLAFYRDWKVLATATLTVATDHLARGLWWPDSVYGIANPEWWRFLEHAAWVAFEDIVLIYASVRGVRELAAAARREASLEHTRDLVERTVTERTLELQETAERYRTLVENTEAVPFEYDVAAQRLLYIAPQATGLLDCAIEDLDERGYLGTAAHADDRATITAAFAACAAGTRAPDEPLDYRIVTKTGRLVHARTFIRRDGERKLRGITLDITRQHQLETELRQAQKLESVGRLAAGVAHEINTPIQFVGDSVEFIRSAVTDVVGVMDRQRAAIHCVIEGEPALELARDAEEAFHSSDLLYLFEELPRSLDRAIDGVGRVARIVRSMKVVAHPDNTEMADVDLNLAIESTLTVARNEYRYVADLVTDLGELPAVRCHAGDINQVILNIAINAAHAIGDVVGQSGDRGKIEVKTRAGDGFVSISISDTGGGIPDAIAPRIFEPFFTTKEIGKGTGQGLAIARSVIVERYRGSLTFDTSPAGTTFHIRLPAAAHSQTVEAA